MATTVALSAQAQGFGQFQHEVKILNANGEQEHSNKLDKNEKQTEIYLRQLAINVPVKKAVLDINAAGDTTVTVVTENQTKLIDLWSLSSTGFGCSLFGGMSYDRKVLSPIGGASLFYRGQKIMPEVQLGVGLHKHNDYSAEAGKSYLSYNGTAFLWWRVYTSRTKNQCLGMRNVWIAPYVGFKYRKDTNQLGSTTSTEVVGNTTTTTTTSDYFEASGFHWGGGVALRYEIKLGETHNRFLSFSLKAGVGSEYQWQHTEKGNKLTPQCEIMISYSWINHKRNYHMDKKTAKAIDNY